MKLPPRERLSSAAIVIALTVVLLVLAVLQYRWSGEVSEAASMRMRANLQASLMGFRQDLHRELAAACVAFQSTPGMDSGDRWIQYAQQYKQWSGTAAHPSLVANVYVWKGGASERAQLQRLDAKSEKFEPAQWPAGFESLRERVQLFSSGLAGFAQHRPIPDSSRGNDRPRIPGGGRGPIPWFVEQGIPALVNPVFEPMASASGKNQRRPAGMSWMIIELNRKVLEDEVFPELTERYFGGVEGYRTAIVAGEDRHLLYSSDKGFDSKEVAKGEGAINLFGPPAGASRPGPNIFLAPAPPWQGRNRAWETHGLPGLMRFEPLRAGNTGNDWELVVQHRNGPLESIVAANRRRSLAISFGILLLLAATMAIIIIASQRAQRLAKLQMDFVAGISHELRTPLTVISSAADNIADGLVDSTQIVRYGTVIKSQTRQLIQLLEQILLFAATRQHVTHYHMRRIEVPQVIGDALESTSGLIQAAGCIVENEIQADLPSIEADPVALSQCLQNLITNAVKYGGEARWLGIRASLSAVGAASEIQISIEDKGIGIAPSEIDQIFDPFYRSPSVAGAQIHGTGLGLPLAKSIAEAMRGRLTVRSQPGKGSTFTLHLPVSPPPDMPAEAEKNVAEHVKTP